MRASRLNFEACNAAIKNGSHVAVEISLVRLKTDA